jgi:hypothetical protein
MTMRDMLRDVAYSAAQRRLQEGTTAMDGRILSDGVDLRACTDAAVAAVIAALDPHQIERSSESSS